MSEFLGTDIKTLDDGGFQFYQIGLISKVLESTSMENFNGFPTPTKVEAPLGTYGNGPKAKRNCQKSYNSVIEIVLYLASNTRPYTPLSVHQCAWFTHNNKASHETALNRVVWFLQVIKDKGLVFNPSKKLVLDFYADADFVVLWGH